MSVDDEGNEEDIEIDETGIAWESDLNDLFANVEKDIEGEDVDWKDI